MLIIRSFNFPFFILKQLILDLRWRLGSVTRGFVRAPWELYMRFVVGFVDVPLTLVLWLCLRWSPFPACLRSAQVRVITTLSYRNQALCYSWTVAYFSEPAMLFSSGDSPQSASSNLSGEGFDEVQPGGHRSLFLHHATSHVA